MSMKIVQFISEVILLICFLVLHGMPSAHADNPCEDNIYLEVGTEGVVPCDFGDFELLGWINGNGNHEETSPFIYWENSQVKGSGSRDYDMLPNGSLVIKNVQVRNNRDYTALYVPFVGPQLYFKVPVRVFALPDPEYPVINGFSRQQYIVQDVGTSGSINCTLNGGRPGVPLEWDYQSDAISMENVSLSNRSNSDGSTNTLLTSRFTITSQSVKRVMLKCKTAGDLAYLFPLVTTIYLHVKRNYPIVNGHANLHHVVIELKKEDELNCSMSRVPQGVLLQWVLLTEEPSGELMLQNETSTVHNEDGTANITLTSRFSVLSPSIRRITLQCRVSGQEADRYLDFTTVDVLILNSFPVVNGHVGRQHVVLHLNRVDELNCSLNGVSQGVSLEWVIITPDASEEFLLEDKHSKTTNEDGTCDVRLYSRLTVHSHSLEHVTMECRASSQMTDQYKEVTTVEILITEKPDVGPLPLPVIDGCYSQQEYCSLTLPRDGALTCSVMHVPPEYTVDRRLNMFANAEGLSLTIINDDHLPDVSGAFDLITRYHYTVDEDTAQSLICCSLSVIHNNKLLNSSTTSLIKWQGTENSSTGISISTLTVVIAVFVVVLALTFLTAITHKRVKRSQKRIVWLCSLQDVERNGDVSLNTRHGNGHIPNSDAHAHEVLPLRGRKEDGHFISEIEVSPL